jgi:hypothetical protein
MCLPYVRQGAEFEGSQPAAKYGASKDGVKVC